MRCEEQWLEAVGNTVRHAKAPARGITAALVVNDTLTSHFWLNLLPMVRDPALRSFVVLSDLEAVCDRLHVRPTLVPCFVVLRGGFMIDWFPAPLPAPGTAADPQGLADAVRRRLRPYEDHHHPP